MFKVVASFAVALLLIASMSESAASENEGGIYAEHCRIAVNYSGQGAPNPIEAMYTGFCLGLMDGLRGANFYLKESGSEMAFCEPPGSLNDDLARVFVSAVDNNPHLKNLRGSLAALVSLRAAYPCGQ